MASISMRIPATQAVAVHKTLDNIAQGLKYEGDPWTASQMMCDTAVERLTGQKHADDMAVEIGILMTPGSLFADEDVPALLSGYVLSRPRSPATSLRVPKRGSADSFPLLAELVGGACTDPMSGNLIDRDPRRRRFDGPLAGFVRERDQQCSRPYCDCRIRDIDHPDPFSGPNT